MSNSLANQTASAEASQLESERDSVESASSLLDQHSRSRSSEAEAVLAAPKQAMPSLKDAVEAASQAVVDDTIDSPPGTAKTKRPGRFASAGNDRLHSQIAEALREQSGSLADLMAATPAAPPPVARLQPRRRHSAPTVHDGPAGASSQARPSSEEAEILESLFPGKKVGRFQPGEFNDLRSRYAVKSFLRHDAFDQLEIAQPLLDALVLAKRNGSDASSQALFDEIRQLNVASPGQTERLSKLIQYQVYAVGHHIMTEDDLSWAVKLAGGLKEAHPELAQVPTQTIAREVAKHAMCKTKFSEPTFAMMRSDTPEFLRKRFRIDALDKGNGIFVREGSKSEDRAGSSTQEEAASPSRFEIMYDCTDPDSEDKAKAALRAHLGQAPRSETFSDEQWDVRWAELNVENHTTHTAQVNLTPYNPAHSFPCTMQVPIMANAVTIEVAGRSYTMGESPDKLGIAITDEDAGVFARSLNSQRVIEIGDYDDAGRFFVFQMKGAGVPEFGFNAKGAHGGAWTGGEYLDIATETEAATLKDFSKLTSDVAHIAPDCLGQAAVASVQETQIYNGDYSKRQGAVTFRMDYASGGMRLRNVRNEDAAGAKAGSKKGRPGAAPTMAALMASIRKHDDDDDDDVDIRETRPTMSTVLKQLRRSKAAEASNKTTEPGTEDLKTALGVELDENLSKTRLGAQMRARTGEAWSSDWDQRVAQNMIRGQAVANLLGMQYDDQNLANLEDFGINGEFFDTGGINDIETRHVGGATQRYALSNLTFNGAIQTLQISDEDVIETYGAQCCESLRRVATALASESPQDAAALSQIVAQLEGLGDGPEDLRTKTLLLEALCGDLGRLNNEDDESVKLAFMERGLVGFAATFLKRVREFEPDAWESHPEVAMEARLRQNFQLLRAAAGQAEGVGDVPAQQQTTRRRLSDQGLDTANDAARELVRSEERAARQSPEGEPSGTQKSAAEAADSTEPASHGAPDGMAEYGKRPNPEAGLDDPQQAARDDANAKLQAMRDAGDVELVQAYNQGDDQRLNDLDFTEGGWCLGMSTMWLLDHHDAGKLSLAANSRVNRTEQAIVQAEQVLAALTNAPIEMDADERSQAMAEQQKELLRLRKVLQTEEARLAAEQGSFWSRHGDAEAQSGSNSESGAEAAARYRFVMAAQSLRIAASDGTLKLRSLDPQTQTTDDLLNTFGELDLEAHASEELKQLRNLQKQSTSLRQAWYALSDGPEKNEAWDRFDASNTAYKKQVETITDAQEQLQTAIAASKRALQEEHTARQALIGTEELHEKEVAALSDDWWQLCKKRKAEHGEDASPSPEEKAAFDRYKQKKDEARPHDLKALKEAQKATEKKLATCRSAQHPMQELSATMDDRAAFRLRNGGLAKTPNVERRENDAATAETLAQDICDTPPGSYCRIGQTYVEGGGHAMAARTDKDGTIVFMDPNGGEFKFKDKQKFKSWFSNYCRSKDYNFRSHYVERYTTPGDAPSAPAAPAPSPTPAEGPERAKPIRESGGPGNSSGSDGSAVPPPAAAGAATVEQQILAGPPRVKMRDDCATPEERQENLQNLLSNMCAVGKEHWSYAPGEAKGGDQVNARTALGMTDSSDDKFATDCGSLAQALSDLAGAQGYTVERFELKKTFLTKDGQTQLMAGLSPQEETAFKHEGYTTGGARFVTPPATDFTGKQGSLNGGWCFGNHWLLKCPEDGLTLDPSFNKVHATTDSTQLESSYVQWYAKEVADPSVLGGQKFEDLEPDPEKKKPAFYWKQLMSDTGTPLALEYDFDPSPAGANSLTPTPRRRRQRGFLSRLSQAIGSVFSSNQGATSLTAGLRPAATANGSGQLHRRKTSVPKSSAAKKALRSSPGKFPRPRRQSSKK